MDLVNDRLISSASTFWRRSVFFGGHPLFSHLLIDFQTQVESRNYGFRWQCPNGDDCMYIHAVPKGYVLKRDQEELKKLAAEQGDEQETIEEQIERERAMLDLSTCTPVTLELFMQWKADKERRRAEEAEAKRKEAAKKDGGKGLNVLTGRDLFRYDPTLFQDDAAADDTKYEGLGYYSDEDEQDTDDNPLYDTTQVTETNDITLSSATLSDASLFVDDDDIPDDLDDDDDEEDDEEGQSIRVLDPLSLHNLTLSLSLFCAENEDEPDEEDD